MLSIILTVWNVPHIQLSVFLTDWTPEILTMSPASWMCICVERLWTTHLETRLLAAKRMMCRMSSSWIFQLWYQSLSSLFRSLSIMMLLSQTDYSRWTSTEIGESAENAQCVDTIQSKVCRVCSFPSTAALQTWASSPDPTALQLIVNRSSAENYCQVSSLEWEQKGLGMKLEVQVVYLSRSSGTCFTLFRPTHLLCWHM